MIAQDVSDILYPKIKDKIKENWNQTDIIRFVYLYTGLFLEKNTDFFLNDKLKNLHISSEEIMNIYQNDITPVRSIQGKESYQVICKSAAIIMKGIFDQLGINSKLIVTCGKDNDVKHWFLVAVGENQEQYFLTLAADLPYIQNSLPTQHFANDISFLTPNRIRKDEKSQVSTYDKLLDYIHSNQEEESDYVVVRKGDNFFLTKKSTLKYIIHSGMDIIDLENSTDILKNYSDDIVVFAQQYEWVDGLKTRISTRDINGISVPYYEIDHTDLNSKPSKLRQIDSKIGKSDIYGFSDIFRSPSFLQNIYLENIEHNSEIYRIFDEAFHLKENDYALPLDEITRESVEQFIANLDAYICKYLNSTSNFNFFSKDNFLQQYVAMNRIFPVNENMSLAECKDNFLKLKGRFTSFQQMLKSAFSLEKQLQSFVEIKELYQREENKLLSQNSEGMKKNNPYEEAYNNVKKKIRKGISPQLGRLSFFFILNQFDYKFYENSDSDYVSLAYVYHKFCNLFPRMFDCNFNDFQTAAKTNFSQQGYSEQIAMIKDFLAAAFPELTEKNCKQARNYNSKFTPVDNRIRAYPLKNVENGEYVIGFRFWAKENSDEEEATLLYDPASNTLKSIDPLFARNKYIVVSNTNALQFEKLEAIEVNHK